MPTAWRTACTYIDRVTGQENHVQARIVVLAASACESARILLNSKSSKFPQGLANSSGTVGKYLTDSTGVGMTGFIPKLMDWMPHNEDGIQGGHLYIPWWVDNKKLDFPRGYHVELSGGRRMPSAGFGGNIQRFSGLDAGREIGGYGLQLKHDYRKFYGATVGFAGRGEMIPNADSYCEIDPNTVDRFGIPVLRFSFKWSDHEINQAKHMQDTFRSIIEEMGGTVLGNLPGRAAELRPRHRRAHDSRNRHHAHGQQSIDVRAEQEQPGARREEPVRGRRRAVRQPGRQESRHGRFSPCRCARASTSRKSAGKGASDVRHESSSGVAGACGSAGRRDGRVVDGSRRPGRESRRRTGEAGRPPDATRGYTPKFFTAHEWATVGLLVDLIIPKDAKSGSATDAGVPEFMDFMMIDQPARQSAMRGGLAWLDAECTRRFDKTFAACTDADRRAVLDDIAWPRRPKPGMSHGVTFFNSFRDLTASGFFTTKMGMDDLEYQGNTFVHDWKGCPPDWLKKIGL